MSFFDFMIKYTIFNRTSSCFIINYTIFNVNCIYLQFYCSFLASSALFGSLRVAYTLLQAQLEYRIS